MKKLETPISRITLDATEKCNLRCGYCFTFGVGKRDLPLEQGIKTIDWLFKDEVSQNDQIDINWWGGEPFFRFDTIKRLTDYACEKAHKEGKALTLGGTTNATLMKKVVVDWMNERRAYFLMSIDGPKDIQDVKPTDGCGRQLMGFDCGEPSLCNEADSAPKRPDDPNAKAHSPNGGNLSAVPRAIWDSLPAFFPSP